MFKEIQNVLTTAETHQITREANQKSEMEKDEEKGKDRPCN